MRVIDGAWMSIGLAAMLATAASAQLNYDRARRNYLGLQAGQVQLGQLSPIELEEVRQLDQGVRTQGLPQRDTRRRCKALLTGGKPTTTLEEAVNDLKCAQRPN